MPKKMLCPECKADLRKVGYSTWEKIWLRFEWTFNKKAGHFESHDTGETESIGSGEVEYVCHKCMKPIDLPE